MRKREAVIYVYYEGMTQKEASEKMGVNEGTVAGYLHRALMKIKHCLEEMYLC